MMTRLTYRAVNGDKFGTIGKRGRDLNGMDHFGNARHALICRDHMAARICQIGDSAAIARAQPQPQAACMSDKVNRSAPCQGACVKQNRLLRQPIQPASRPKSQIFSNLGQFTASPTGAVRGFVATAFTAAPSDRLNDSVSPPVTPPKCSNTPPQARRQNWAPAAVKSPWRTHFAATAQGAFYRPSPLRPMVVNCTWLANVAGLASRPHTADHLDIAVQMANTSNFSALLNHA